MCCVYTHTLTVHATNIFLESPTSVNTITGGTAEFRCQLKPDVQALVEWNINGVSPNKSLGQFIYDDGGLQRLIIYEVLRNNTNVSCMAQQLNGSRLVLLGTTDQVQILLQGKCMV